ncbi:helix-turn-helix transcriptional regulator [Kitasatospora purpeofusca]|uniref:helix-turn-helix domain-containing protein n=1 Tax=Kitasatospora purpeofusca TaxID=67352 RepID=UPI002A59E5D4|nr:helix-turn-helix transcriptional regulator [Kitasatospora purpeofusca]MDY0811874.1 helix-turn-helix transcriptional regulator [Kitasatospora purpeofusca]
MTIDIGGALRKLRQAAGKEAKAVARGAAMSPSQLSRIETGRTTPSTIDVERILSAIGVPDAVRADLVEMARREATETVAWRFLRRAGFHHHQDSIRAVEAETAVQRVFQPSCVPGLCQTPEYVRAVLAPKGLTPDVLARTVAARLERQSVLFDARKSFRYLITESVLRWLIVPPAQMAVQIDRIMALSRLPNVHIGVVPLSARMTEVSSSSFIVYDNRLVIVEIPHAEISTTDPKDVDLYLARFRRFEQVSLDGDAMREMLAHLRDEFLRQRETS